MTTTPRTDAYEFALLQFGIAPQEAETDNNGPILSMNRHARTIETELAASRAECERLREALENLLRPLEKGWRVSDMDQRILEARAALRGDVCEHEYALSREPTETKLTCYKCGRETP